MSSATLSHCAVAGDGIFLGDKMPPGLDIYWNVDRLSTGVIEFYMGCIVFTSILLPCGRVLVVCMRVSLVEPPFQIAMRWIPVLEYMLSGPHGLLQPRPISSGNECYRPLRP
jgi:hypothetical protein